MDSLRSIVSGKRKRYIDSYFNLDLSYITERLIAMSFPSCGFESCYRNKIGSVVDFLSLRHSNNYMIFNASGRQYDYRQFGGKIFECGFKNHFPPTLRLLFNVCNEIHKFLEADKKNVAIIHCQAGKGRTGTLISSYLIYSGLFSSAKAAMKYFGYKRFENGTGVTNPSQRRYVEYFEQVYKNNVYSSQVVTLSDIWISNVGNYNLEKLYILIYFFDFNKNCYIPVNIRKGVFFKIGANKIRIAFSGLELCGDYLIRLMHKSFILNDDMLCRISFNTAMIGQDLKLNFHKYDIDPDNVQKNFRNNFSFVINFQKCIQCLIASKNEKRNAQCFDCKSKIKQDIEHWKAIYFYLREYKYPDLPSQFTNEYTGKTQKQEMSSKIKRKISRKKIIQIL